MTSTASSYGVTQMWSPSCAIGVPAGRYHAQSDDGNEEAEVSAARDHGLGHSHQALQRRQRQANVCLHPGRVGQAVEAKKADQGIDRDAGGEWLAVLAALDEQRELRAPRIAEAAAVDHARAGRVPGVDQQVAGDAQLAGEGDVLLDRAAST